MTELPNEEMPDQARDQFEMLLEMQTLLRQIHKELLSLKTAAPTGTEIPDLEKYLSAFNAKIQTLQRMQHRDNQQMADSLNAILEKIYAILEKWGGKVAAIEDSNAILGDVTKRALYDLIVPNLQNLLRDLQREIHANTQSKQETAANVETTIKTVLQNSLPVSPARESGRGWIYLLLVANIIATFLTTLK